MPRRARRPGAPVLRSPLVAAPGAVVRALTPSRGERITDAPPPLKQECRFPRRRAAAGACTVPRPERESPSQRFRSLLRNPVMTSTLEVEQGDATAHVIREAWQEVLA